MPDLIARGYLVPTLCYAPVDPDLRGVRTQAGDYAVGQLESRMNTDQLVGDIVSHWYRLGQNRPTVVFAVGVAHSIHLRDEFLNPVSKPNTSTATRRRTSAMPFFNDWRAERPLLSRIAWF